jgi:hypothetical protein
LPARHSCQLLAIGEPGAHAERERRVAPELHPSSQERAYRIEAVGEQQDEVGKPDLDRDMTVDDLGTPRPCANAPVRSTPNQQVSTPRRWRTRHADAGGSNGYRPRAWKWFLARLAEETGLEITVVHYPPGTSKWNKIEHRLFSFISMNWRGRALTDMRTIVELIAATTTDTGLTVQAAHDPGWYERGIKITNAQIDQIPLHPHDWHGEWNYTITPR